MFFERPLWTPIFLVINAAVFVLWQYKGLKDPFMIENFYVSPAHVMLGKWWTLITSTFSHNLFFHFFINAFILYNMGSVIEILLGKKKYFFFYLYAGIAGSLGHVFVSYFLIGDPRINALGASGAISGVLLFFSFAFPKERLYILGLIPIPALFGALIFMGLDVWGLIAQTKGGGLPIGHGAHLGGALAGILYFYYERRKRRKVLKNPYV